MLVLCNGMSSSSCRFLRPRLEEPRGALMNAITLLLNRVSRFDICSKDTPSR